MSSVVKAAPKSQPTKKNVPEKIKTTKSSSKESVKDSIAKKKKEEETKISTSKSKTSLKSKESKPAISKSVLKVENKPTTSKPISKVENKPAMSKSVPKLDSNPIIHLNLRKPSSNSKLTNKDSPKTPPGNKSRVTRTQFFPSKNLYSNALKSLQSETKGNAQKEEAIPSNKERTKNTIPTPKQDQEESSLEASTISERPGTATLRKPSIVNANIVGPDVPRIKISKTKIETDPESPNSSEKYESDFDSYESDFEKYVSSDGSDDIKNISGEETSSISSGVDEEPPKSPTSDTNISKMEYEKKMDSGTFDLADFKYRHMLDNIKESIDQENLKLITNNPASLSDEGFEDQKSLQFINFADAQRKCEKRKNTALRKKRGEEILSMIRLDYVNFTIFDSPAVSYDEFIRRYGSNNSVQASVQTGEDNVSEESQTDLIEKDSKWTQNPVTFSNFDINCDNFWDVYKADYLGVGNDEIIENSKAEPDYDSSKLRKFLNNSVELMLGVLAEENLQKIKDIKENKRDLPFSDGYLQFNTSEDIFHNTAVRNVSILAENINKILSVHVKTTKTDDITSIVCCWDISNYESPQHTFISFGRVKCCTFSSEFILAGEEDGSIIVWDIRKSSKSYDLLVRSPTYSTGVDKAHNSEVVAIQSFQCEVLENNSYFEASQSFEVCSLDQDGKLIFWNLLPKSNISLTMIKTEEVNLQTIFKQLNDMQCTDMVLNKNDIYVSTNYGEILHYSIDGARCKVKQFTPDLQVSSDCLELCPFSSAYFVAGYSNGNLSVFSKNSSKPLRTLSNRDDVDSSSIQIVKWSRCKPFVLFAKDLKNVLHIWDLAKSEIYPQFSIPFSEKITCLQLSPLMNVKETETSYMTIGTDTGKIYMHILNKNYVQEDYAVYINDVDIFLNYVNRL